MLDPSDFIGRTFLLPPEENGERYRAKVTRQVVEIIDQDNGQRIENINFILDIGNGKVEELISYNQLLEHLENAQDNDEQCLQVTLAMPPGSLRVIALKGHQSFLLAIPLVIITFICNQNSYTTTTSVIHSEFRSA